MGDQSAIALDFLRENWTLGFVNAADGCALIGMNRGTFRVRLGRGHALALVDQREHQREPALMTGYHLVWNMLAEPLFRFGFPFKDGSDFSVVEIATRYAHEVQRRFELEHWDRGWTLSFGRAADGEPNDQPSPLEAHLVIPIGRMVLDLALRTHETLSLAEGAAD